MTECKSPTHKRYRDAVEGLYFQAHLAQQDLTRTLEQARAMADLSKTDKSVGRVLIYRQHELAEVIDRLTFGRDQLAEAEHNVNVHLARGCRNVTDGLARVSA
jgi:hypothetical protein